VATASPSKTSPARGAPQGAVRKVFRNDRGLRAGWRLLIYIVLMALPLLLVAALSEFATPRSGMFWGGLPVLIGFACALEAAQVMSRIEKRPVSTYGLPVRGAFGKLFWQGWLAGLIEISVVIGLVAAFHGYSFGKLAEGGVVALGYGVSWAVVSVVASLFAEFTFRGYTQYTLASGIGFWPAAEVLSALFACRRELTSRKTGLVRWYF
jgi:uncharacterized protein